MRRDVSHVRWHGVAGAYAVALVLTATLESGDTALHHMSVSGLVGSLTIMAAAALISLGVFGLYAPEAFVCRPLLLAHWPKPA